jgi:hypothetical protein
MVNCWCEVVRVFHGDETSRDNHKYRIIVLDIN